MDCDAHQGLGGPQPAETERMLKAAQQRLDAARTWLREKRNRLANADAALDKAFAALLRVEKSP